MYLIGNSEKNMLLIKSLVMRKRKKTQLNEKKKLIFMHVIYFKT